MRLQNALILMFAAATFGTSGASAQVSDDVVRIGVLNDQSGLYADLGGQGSVVAALMAVEDTGGSVLGKPVEIIFRRPSEQKLISGWQWRAAGSKPLPWIWR